MKLLQTSMLRVEYFGVLITVPNKVQYMATDKNGIVKGFHGLPDFHEDGIWRGFCDDIILAEVDLEGLDWTETLLKVY